jgi:hypothetical protein
VAARVDLVGTVDVDRQPLVTWSVSNTVMPWPRSRAVLASELDTAPAMRSLRRPARR